MGGAGWFSLISRDMVTLPVWAARLSLILEAGHHSPLAVNQEVTLTELLAVPLVKDRFALFPAAHVGSQGDGKASPGQKKRGGQRPQKERMGKGQADPKRERGKARPKRGNGEGQALTGKDGEGQAQPKREKENARKTPRRRAFIFC